VKIFGSYMGFISDVIMITVIVSCFITGMLCMLCLSIGEDRGFRLGYIAALDDIRQGNPAKYKLVQVAEKWVEVK
jgi:hypothetical protein